MALLTKEEFCELTGIEKRSIPTYVKRGKIILSGELIDQEIPQNQEFIKHRLDKFADKIQKKTPEVKQYNNVSPNYSNIKAPEYKPPTEQKQSGSIYSLEVEHKQLLIQKTAEEIEKLKLHNAKAAGESIPTDMVIVVFAQFSKSITTSFKNSVENILTELAHKQGISDNILAQYKGLLIREINSGVDRAVNESQHQISNIVNEYIVKREQGEKE
jgi:hypothetical protein